MEKIKKEIKNQDSLIPEHTLKIEDSKKKNEVTTLDELLQKASLEELYQYQEYFCRVRDVMNYYEFYDTCDRKDNLYDCQYYIPSLPMRNKKVMKLELVPDVKK